MKNKKKGFTLVELLVVIAILAVLASVSVIGYVGFTKKAHESACIQEATQARTAILAELTDGDSTSFTLVNGDVESKKTETDRKKVAVVNSEFGLGDLKGSLSVDLDSETFTYTSEDTKYSATFKLDGNPVSLLTK